MERECTPACVAYSASNEVSEGAKKIGMNDLHCMRLLLDFANAMGITPSDDFYDEEDF